MIQELGSNLVPVLSIVCTFLFFVIWVVAATIDSIYKISCNSRLKERLVDRGASASEIHRIIRAGKAEAEETEFVEPVPPVKARDSYQVSNQAF